MPTSAIMQEVREFAKKFFYNRPNAQKLMRQVELPRSALIAGNIKLNYEWFELYGENEDRVFTVFSFGFQAQETPILISEGAYNEDIDAVVSFFINVPGIYLLTTQTSYNYSGMPEYSDWDRPGSVYIASGYSGESRDYFKDIVSKYPGAPTHTTPDYNERSSEYRLTSYNIIRASNDRLDDGTYKANDFYYYWESPLSNSEIFDPWPGNMFYFNMWSQLFRLCNLEDDFLDWY